MQGDQTDFFKRIKSLLPNGWFGDNSPVLDALLWGMSQALAWCFSLYLYAKAQTRILTATDGWLDLIAYDFFGTSLQRGNLNDSSFRNRIQINIFRERGTRNAISKILYDLTGRYPTITEPQLPSDVGYYGGMAGYGVAGCYGSLSMPYQAFVTVYRSPSVGLPYVAGYGTSTGGYSQASRADYASISQIGLTDADLIAAVESVKPFGTTIWMQIKS
ncbi:hypothetical protein E0H86_07090 [Acinetobacter sp. ANC 4635]|uniref:hypothetical protein n=1 Tax=Acinetobacter sp. ANC 4635 TaxID=2529846 RepID=UPI00103E93DB|nr:hypothetical protein [Acinetobacter sp. ANC 4635]TCB32173.1 hypothetical protein E0H86_07090 [Acinetobacter sp. ANC 4635]